MQEKEYEIFFTQEFERDFEKLERKEKSRVKKSILKLKTQPYTGKPLGYDFFREKKIGSNRLYFLIYEELIVVFVIAFGGKKTQQETIKKIKQRLPEYKKEIEKAFKKRI